MELGFIQTFNNVSNLEHSPLRSVETDGDESCKRRGDTWRRRYECDMFGGGGSLESARHSEGSGSVVTGLLEGQRQAVPSITSTSLNVSMEKQQLTLDAHGPTADLILRVEGTGRKERKTRPTDEERRCFTSRRSGSF